MPKKRKTTAGGPKLVVGIGASAGGIEACAALLEAVPENSGLAFILVLHLDPTRASHIAEILQGRVRHLTVTQTGETTRLEPNHAYVIAPKSKLHFTDSVLEADALAENEARGRLVDFLFESLAKAEGARAAGVVLSGAGRDGTAGLRRIQSAGGLGLAQDPATAGTDSMPRSAIDARVVDAVLAPEAIPAALVEFAEGGKRPSKANPRASPEDKGGRREGGVRKSGFERILEQLGALADVNFDDYKTGTLERRTRRRMGLKGIDDWDEYAERLADDGDELDALYYDVLIGVTDFFRDPEAWEQLAEELPALLDGRDPAGARAWVPGCGTGEEAYTLAMLLRERIPAGRHNRIQVYATDLNERALVTARRGLYPPEAIEHIAPERREQHFHQNNGYLQIERSVRDCVTFAPHNVLVDAPFSKMDIVTCRNLLIYLERPAHERLLQRLHFALRPGGLLLLGRAETPGRQAGLFEEISSHQSLYRARPVSPQERFHVVPRTIERPRGDRREAASQVAKPARRDRETGAERRIERFVLREHTPACVAIDAGLEIRHFYGRTQRYLVPPTGESRQDLLAWIRPGFYIRLRSALKQAVESGESLATEGQIDRDGESRRVRCTVEPIPAAVGADRLFLVTFHDLGESALTKIDPSQEHEPLVRELEQELADTRRELQSTVEQLESAGEEHHASNEELQSLNEELQSSNEELEASKEELEALNEEMNTINRELEEKNTDLRGANADLNSLFLSTGIPTVFLDRDLRVRRFTEAATDVMRLVPSDIGRSIGDIKERFDDGRTLERSRHVLTTLDVDSTGVAADDGRYYVRNIVPYRLDDQTVDGICITFSDVTDQKRATHESEKARAYAEAVIETVRTPLMILDETLRVQSINTAFRTAFDTPGELVGSVLEDARDRQWNVPSLDPLLETLLSEGTNVDDFEVASQGRMILVNARRVDGGDDPDRLVLSFEDVTEQREARSHADRRADELRSDARRKDEWIAMLGHELRNPVGAIGNGIELLKSAALSAERQTQVIGMMKRQLGHVSGLLDELLDAARIISGKLEIEKKPVDLTLIGEWSVDTVRPLITARGHELTVTLPPAGSVWVQGDRLRLTEVITNLLGNAAKYTEPGGRITLEVTADADSATISVRDNGIGIPSEFKERMFEIFTQGPRTLARSDRGLGLGLPLVRTLVELHGGEVAVHSDGDGKGSEFTVTLPRHRHASSAEAPGAEVNGPAPKRRILIVDDVRDVAESLEMLLEQAGHKTRIALDGRAALETAKEFKPEVLLLDLGLPGMDGYALARGLREAFPGAVLIAVTGYQRDASQLDAAGFDHYLIKPIDMDRLSALLAG